MRLALIALLLASPVALAKDRPRTVSFAGAGFTLAGGGSEPEPDRSEVRYGPRPEQVMAVETEHWKHRDVIYTLTVTRLPEAIASATPATLLAGAKRGLVGQSGTGGVLESESARQVDGHPGLALAMRAGKLRVRARVVVADKRVIQLTAVGPPRAVESEVANKTLDSLTVSDVEP